MRQSVTPKIHVDPTLQLNYPTTWTTMYIDVPALRISDFHLDCQILDILIKTFYPPKVSIAVPKPGLREANSIEADDKEGAVAAYYQQYGYGAAQQQQGYYGQQQAGKGPAVLVSAQVGQCF